MKFPASIALLLTVSSALAAEPAATAYTALRVVGKQSGSGALNRVIEMRGRNGSPQPAVWKIILSEPSARGGIREVEVQRGKVIGERTPVARGAVGEKMDFSRLNLDSEGVFTIVEQEMKKTAQAFDRLDYSLRSGSGGGAPVWTVEIYDGRSGKVGSMLLAADTGAVLEQSNGGAPAGGVATDRDYLRGNPSPPVAQDDNVYRARDPEPRYSDGRHSQPGEPFRGIGDFFHRLGNRAVRRGENLENFFTGKKGEQAYDR
ncbi:MAG: hypothetical protein ABIZ56_03870 [Chthoniobacteraceae bacterium]